MSTDVLFLEGVETPDKLIYVSSMSLAAIFVLECCQQWNGDIVFVENSSLSKIILNEKYFPLAAKNLSFTPKFIQHQNSPQMIQNCNFPAVLVPQKSWCVVGLSASLRYILMTIFQQGQSPLADSLLGFRHGCLQACAEVSIWTKFCEIEILQMLNEVYTVNYDDFDEIIFPSNILRFEQHLKHPPILHNALKWKQKVIRDSTLDKKNATEFLKKKLSDLPNLDHLYAEGLELTLADLLLYVSIWIVTSKLKIYVDFKENSPLVLRWLKLIQEKQFVQHAQPILSDVLQNFQFHNSPNLKSVVIPQVSDDSLYKSDPNRYKPCWRAFTNQHDIDKALKPLTKLSIELKTIDFSLSSRLSFEKFPDISKLSLQQDISRTNIIDVHVINIKHGINWTTLPNSITLKDQIPSSRFERKCQQLENMLLAVISIAKEGDQIIDFCSGCGYLGILLAYFLPKCKIILAENKTNSLERAFKIVGANALKNVEFYQCNLDYYNGKFDIGTCLHACGVSTDLVLQKCVENRASFVCCPCCYGAVKVNHILQYPRSCLFRQVLKVNIEDYLILSHAADQTHDSENHKTKQGIACMRYIDFDRISYAKENDYLVKLAVMSPSTCSPKNHILIGTPLNNSSYAY